MLIVLLMFIIGSQFAMLLCWLPAQVGAVSDFARVEKAGEAAMADFVGRRYSGEAGHRAPEGASRARHGQRRSRQTRTSTTFAAEPSSEPYSFQVFLRCKFLYRLICPSYTSFSHARVGLIRED